MERMKVYAKRLDIFFNIMQVVSIVAAVASAIALLLISAYFVFNLDAETIGTGYQMLDLGFAEFELADSFMPNKRIIIAIDAVEIAMSLILALLSRACIAHIRNLLVPMKDGLPFHTGAPARFKRLALLVLIAGITINCSKIINQQLLIRYYELSELFLSEKILAASFSYKVDHTCLLISGLLLLLSYIFSYGQSLQQLSDETI